MIKRLSPETPMILSVAAQFLAVIAALWLIWPLRVGPIYYSEVSIVNTDGLGVLPMLFAPSALILAGTVALYMWATRASRMAKWVAWTVCALLLLAALVEAMSFGLFFLPAVVTMLAAVILQRRIYREMYS
ncbi:MAG: hypothetical protein OXC95_18190 [Dehalococcoidia bacterium]|nr:hypothetical protein [Dehalococcoidia bacterium]